MYRQVSKTHPHQLEGPCYPSAKSSSQDPAESMTAAESVCFHWILCQVDLKSSSKTAKHSKPTGCEWPSKTLQAWHAPFFLHLSRRSMISLIFQKHPCATDMTLVTHQIHHASLKKSNLVKVGGPQKSAEQEFLPNSNSISALLATDKGPKHGPKS